MTKEFVPHDRSLKLKELGFNEPCITKYVETSRGFILELTNICTTLGQLPSIDALTFSQAFRFFREKYKPEELNFYIHLLNTYNTPKHYLHCYTIRRGVSVIEVATRDTYEEAELACLDKLIEIVESKLK
jgi:hypothetical protein